MASVVKRSISLPAEVFEALELQAAEEGQPFLPPSLTRPTFG
jgi:hypothetical protein